MNLRSLLTNNLCPEQSSNCRRTVRLARLLTCVAVSVFTLSACTTAANYRLAKDGTPPADLLNYANSDPKLGIRLASVIVNKGHGSWKENALWDEYVLSLNNPDTGPVVIESVILVDMLGTQQSPGVDPWELEKLSETNWKKYQHLGLVALDAAGLAGSFMLPSFAYGLTGATSGLLTAIPLVAVSTVAVVSVLDQKNRTSVEQQFESRRIKLPLDLPTGASVHGSLFFPIVPRPQRLVLQGSTSEGPLVHELDLKPLADLHIKQQAEHSRSLPPPCTCK